MDLYDDVFSEHKVCKVETNGSESLKDNPLKHYGHGNTGR